MTDSNDYKSELYAKYHATHIVPRKGTASLAQFRRRQPVFRHQFLSLLPGDKQARIVDLGCGNGSLVWWLQQEGYEQSSGIDLNPDLVAAGTALGVRNLQQGNFTDHLQQAANTLDVIILRDVLEHFPKSEIIGLLRRCCEALRVPGVLIIHVPNAAAPFASKLRYEDFTHELSFTNASLHQILLLAGFDRIQCLPSKPPVVDLRSLLRAVATGMLTPPTKVFMKIMVGGEISIVTPALIAVAAKQQAVSA